MRICIDSNQFLAELKTTAFKVLRPEEFLQQFFSVEKE